MNDKISQNFTISQNFREIYTYALKHSDDPETKSGCLIETMPTGTYFPLTFFGANRIPEGIQKKPWMLERPHKYNYIEHAERDAIYAAARAGISLAGATLYVNWAPCFDCFRAIVATGIKEIFIHKEGHEAYTQAAAETGHTVDWGAERVLEAFDRSPVKLNMFSATFDGTVKGVFRGKEVYF
jgi:deoxycytidylate deaminase